MSAFHARILASDTLFFDGDCEFMVVPCTDGAMGILSHHSNMIAAVVPGELRFQPMGGPLRTAAVSAGLVKVEAVEVMLLVSTAERPEDIDVNRARRAEDADGGDLVTHRQNAADLLRRGIRLPVADGLPHQRRRCLW